MPPEPSAALELSLVIPAFDEALRIERTLRDIVAFASARAARFEIIVIDDGSADATASVVEKFAAANRSEACSFDLLRNRTNRGKGFSLRRGIEAAARPHLLLLDADGSTPIEQVDRLLPPARAGIEFVIGSRDKTDSRLDPPQPLLRRLPAAAFRTLRRALLLRRIHDTQCGFKLIERSAARTVLPLCRESRWLFDCELLAVADRLGFRIAEVGVLWRNDPATHVSVPAEAWRAPAALLRIRRRLAAIRPAER